MRNLQTWQWYIVTRHGATGPESLHRCNDDGPALGWAGVGEAGVYVFASRGNADTAAGRFGGEVVQVDIFGRPVEATTETEGAVGRHES